MRRVAHTKQKQVTSAGGEASFFCSSTAFGTLIFG